MVDIDRITIRTWSMLGMRGTLGDSLVKLAADNDKIFGLTSDLCKTSGMDKFSSIYPDRFINVGIAEQNMVGIAAGLADSGYIPFATTFANFAVLRANESVRHFMAYMKCNVKLIGFGAGFAMELFGNTHYGLEDVSVLRSFPNITILQPSDGLSVYKCIELASELLGPVYIRLTGKMNLPIIYKNDIDFRIKKNNILIDGDDVIIYASGSIEKLALDVAQELLNNGITCRVVDVYSIKPFDDSELLEKKYKLIVTLEEHSIIGGLGSILAENIVDHGVNTKLLRFGTTLEYKLPGDYNYMLSSYGLTRDNIINNILLNIKEN